MSAGHSGRRNPGSSIHYWPQDQSPQHAKEVAKQTNLYRASAGARPNQTLCTAMTLDDFRHARWDLAEAIELAQRASGQPPVRPLNPDDDAGVSHLSLKEIRRRASFAMAARLSMIRPRPMWDVLKDQWVTTWDVGTLEAAMYLMLLFDIQGRGQILTCPRCRKVFVADRARTQFCSNPCQNAAKVQRFRARQAQRERPSDTKHDQEKKHRHVLMLAVKDRQADSEPCLWVEVLSRSEADAVSVRR